MLWGGAVRVFVCITGPSASTRLAGHGRGRAPPTGGIEHSRDGHWDLLPSEQRTEPAAPPSAGPSRGGVMSEIAPSRFSSAMRKPAGSPGVRLSLTGTPSSRTGRRAPGWSSSTTISRARTRSDSSASSSPSTGSRQQLCSEANARHSSRVRAWVAHSGALASGRSGRAAVLSAHFRPSGQTARGQALRVGRLPRAGMGPACRGIRPASSRPRGAASRCRHPASTRVHALLATTTSRTSSRSR